MASGDTRPLDLEHRALLRLLAGTDLEKVNRHAEAAEQYREGLAFEPGDPFCAYFLHNNYGYCLNILGRHAEAEWYCRAAIDLDPSRPNGFKNLGISYAERGEYERATDAWIAATYTYPEDPRSLGLLEDLLDERPDLERKIRGLGAALEECRLAVRLVGARSWES
jgi:tetratricopeptide (TPR) repeat protein